MRNLYYELEVHRGVSDTYLRLLRTPKRVPQWNSSSCEEIQRLSFGSGSEGWPRPQRWARCRWRSSGPTCARQSGGLYTRQMWWAGQGEPIDKYDFIAFGILIFKVVEEICNYTVSLILTNMRQIIIQMCFGITDFEGFFFFFFFHTPTPRD